MKSKRTALRALTIGLLLWLFHAPVRAEIFGVFYYNAAGQGPVTISGCIPSASGAIEIPAVIDGRPVTAIGSYAFLERTGLTSVTIPTSVTAIYFGAFMGCTGLTSFTIPDSVTTLESGAFWGCTGLTAIDAGPLNPKFSSVDGVLFDKNRTALNQFPGGKAGPYSIPAGVTAIGNAAFAGGRGVTSVSIPNSVTDLAGTAFSGCTSLTSVSIPESLTSIQAYTFSGCTSLGLISIPDSVTFVAEYAFANCTSLTSAILGSGVTGSGAAAFAGCTSLTSVSFGPNVTVLNDYSFKGCTGLTSVTLPANVSRIEPGAFEGCTGLTSFSIPDSVTSLGHTAFTGCTGLASITIGSGLTQIVFRAFEGCTSLTSVSIPVGVTLIGDYAFAGCTALTSVSIGTGVTGIGWYAFVRCTGLNGIEVSPLNPNYSSYEGVLFDKNRRTLLAFPGGKAGPYTIPAGVTAALFLNCPNLTSLTVTASVTPSGGLVMSGCTGLVRIDVDPTNPSYSSLDGVLFNKNRTTLHRYPEGKAGPYSIPATVTAMSANAFKECTGLTSVGIPGGVTLIDQDVFRGCTSLASVSIPNSVARIGYGSFRDCTGLTSVSIPGSVKLINGSAFRDCTSLASVLIGHGLTEIGDYAFAGCASLASVNIPASVTIIVNGSFEGCTSLASITIPGSVKFIQDGAFRDCSRLATLSIGQGVTEIAASAFENCTALTSVFIPASVATILHSAFTGCSSLTAINVDPLSPHFSSLDGVLFDKNRTSIIRYPQGRTGTFSVPSTVRNILRADAFKDCPGLQAVIFEGNAPSTDYPSVPNIIFTGAAPGFTIYYFSGSTGFTSPWWQGAPAVMIDGTVHPAAEWLIGYGLPYNADLQDDPNGDGVSLLMAYALNLDPNLNLRASLPVPVLGPQNLSLSFHGTRPGITYAAETSTDLLNWTTAGVILSAPGPDGRRTASVARDGPVRYLRLAVAH